MQLTILIREEGRCYISRCRELEVASCGDTPDEALENIREALYLYLENARALGVLQGVETVLTVKGSDTTGE